jgi:Fe-S cluster assembly ATP-binding protein
MINARGTKFSIFDEPEAGIDLWSFNNLIKVFEKMHERTHGCIMIISHQERIMNIADYIAVVADGKVSRMGTREEILPTLMNETGSACCSLRNK